MPALELEDPHQSNHGADSLRHMVEHAAHLLPAQGPIEAFVHHNTLHAFEEQSFDEAVKLGMARYHAEPYLSELKFRQLYTAGRITDHDLEAAIHDDLGERSNEQINGLGTRCEIRYGMLRHALQIGPDAELRWVVAETDALHRFREEATNINRSRIVSAAKKWLLESSNKSNSIDALNGLLEKFGSNSTLWSDAAWESFSLHLLWRTCLKGVRSFPAKTRSRPFVRPRDLLLHATGEDIDRNVHEVLIMFSAAYLDQGYSDWLLPNRDRGFFESFVALYSENSYGLDRWLRRLPAELALLRDNEVTPECSIEASLKELGVADSDREEFITQTLLALGGWAGMIWQIESGIDWVVHTIPKGSLIGMLAVTLILEKHAIRNLGGNAFSESDSLAAIAESARKRLADSAPLKLERQAFLLFQVAQMLGWTPLELQQLSDSQWKLLSDEVELFSGIERRRIFHEAYERKYRHAALGAFATHAARRKEIASPWGERPNFQIVTCIDDREESFRRHLEEVHPKCQTFGAAGFFAVAMYYRGAADGFYKPLCPGVITPDHYVQEDVGYTFEGVHQGRAELRRRLGLAGRAFHTRSRTFIGGMFAGLFGSLATAPLVARVLFPHLTSRIRRRFGSLLQPPPVTKLQLERYAVDPGPANIHIGYTTDEMAGVVVRLLQDIGLTKTEDFSRLFVVCGHGSSSLNNPHESAYCCGACAGKRGGPNARAFAMMANDWRVRAKVAKLGIAIPDDTTFVGAYHNTCDDSVVFYDLDQLPSSHREEFEAARAAIEESRCRNAHERCRRFVSAPLNISNKDALRHVEARAQDISQARPEYNHATNALCIVGRRDWTRGLFLDRRAFLTSYDSRQDDDEHSILLRILSAAIPVCAGINLEYYFSCVDYSTYGSGSKLPHNIVSLLGVMEGTSSDLRTGLYQQMVEIHEPLRITFVIETTPEAMLSIMERNPAIARLCRGCWSHLAVIDPETSQIQVFRDGGFQTVDSPKSDLPQVDSSLECYQGERGHLPFFSIAETTVSQ
ncbi:DUF2309 domain-containing protein [Lignipirellula cremea]|uniref:Probable inorganic carbon transporter subunit DabA n=1 Tax=Lignipirellula cremea TaxID=2528010 RepID=A0A518E4B4_9BACT|nr:DUF2309 domain-containing protein [Lignipirellula cremea]QDU98908.1 hypothetical protein Pla8534_68190 [Lignipirellula cremea]